MPLMTQINIFKKCKVICKKKTGKVLLMMLNKSINYSGLKINKMFKMIQPFKKCGNKLVEIN